MGKGGRSFLGRCRHCQFAAELRCDEESTVQLAAVVSQFLRDLEQDAEGGENREAVRRMRRWLLGEMSLGEKVVDFTGLPSLRKCPGERR